MPSEVIASSTDTVDAGPAAASVPESAAVVHGAVGVVVAVCPRIVVAVVRGKLHPVVSTESIASVARIPGNLKLVVARLAVYNERTVLGVVPAEVGPCLQVSSQLVAATQCQLTEQFVAEPEVASHAVSYTHLTLPTILRV